jgi:hypothetical protein
MIPGSGGRACADIRARGKGFGGAAVGISNGVGRNCTAHSGISDYEIPSVSGDDSHAASDSLLTPACPPARFDLCGCAPGELIPARLLRIMRLSGGHHEPGPGAREGRMDAREGGEAGSPAR